MTNYIYLWFDQLAKTSFIGGAFLLASLASILLTILMNQFLIKTRPLTYMFILLIGFTLIAFQLCLIMSNYNLN